MLIPKMEKKIPLQLADVVATVKNLLVTPLDFYQKLINFRSVTLSPHITFGAAYPNSIIAKRNADTKKRLEVMFIPRKNNGHLIFLSSCHGSSKILGYMCFSLIKVILH